MLRRPTFWIYYVYGFLNASVGSAVISSFYGMKDYALNYSISNTKLLFSSLTATAAAALLSSTGGYFAPFVLLLVMSILSLVLVFTIRRP